ncbi:2'-5' RNA ligase family protein [Gaetbulibacter sp. M235]|uniref:2'-5' RNA ligase family protein n=1 Tax=Gaetbulibacter sp. M235 TaxID=3126510 RepID=UPI00374EC4F6
MSEIKIYNLRIVPSPPVLDDVENFKSSFIETFGKQPLSKSKPHITLAVFEMDSKYQDILVNVFNQLSSIKKFQLETKGFDIFENNANVLFIKIPLTEDIKLIHKNIKILWIRDLHRKERTIIIPDVPHMTISKTYNNKTLHESLDFFQKMNYPNKHFEIDHLTLISRPHGKTWDWEHQIKLS